MVDFVKKFEAGEFDEKLLKKALNNHSEISKTAMIGKGYDRHLFALSICARVNHSFI